MDTTDFNLEKFSDTTASDCKTRRPRFRSGLLPQREIDPPVMDEHNFVDLENLGHLPAFVHQNANPFALMSRLVKPALIAWTVVSGLYFVSSVFFFQPASALSDGYKTYSDKGKAELDVAFEYTAADGHFKGDESVPDSLENRQKFAQGKKVEIFYNPINARDYETDRNDKLALAITPAWALFAWTAAPFLVVQNEPLPLVLPRRRRTFK